MGLIADIKKLIYAEEVKYKSAVSESTWYKIGGAINFILNRNHQEKQFFANGVYSIMGNGQTGVDGLVFFEFDAEIFGVWVFNMKQGVSGTTEIDVKKRPISGGAWTSIFSVTPKFIYGCGNEAMTGIGIADTTYIKAPVLTSPVVNVNRGDCLRLDLTQVMAQAENCGILIHYRPR